MNSTKRILLVDDEASFTRLTSLMLEQSGKYEVRAVNRAAEILPALNSFSPDLVVMDVIMPDASGIDIARRMKANPAQRGIPIIFLTASISKEDPARWDSGVEGISFKIEDDLLLQNPVLTKPVGSKELMAKIDEVLAGQ